MEEVIKTLQKLKRLILVNSDGEVYMLRDYTVLTDQPIPQPKSWWSFTTPKDKLYTYVSKVELSNGITYDFTHSNVEITKYVNTLIDDRKRYFNLQRSLKAMGCVIATHNRR